MLKVRNPKYMRGYVHLMRGEGQYGFHAGHVTVEGFFDFSKGALCNNGKRCAEMLFANIKMEVILC